MDFIKRDVRGWKCGETGRVWYHLQFYHQNRRKPVKRTEELWQCPECGRHNHHRFVEENHRHYTPTVECVRCHIVYSRQRERGVRWPLGRFNFIVANRTYPADRFELLV